MFWIQLCVLLGLILVGAQLKGIGLGIMGALGTLIFVYVFGLPIEQPPIDVMLIIFCVVTAAASLQVSGGMDYLVSIAEKIIRSNPKSITFIGPLVTFTFVALAGTAHISYSILPIISEVAVQSNVRPERPLSISVIAAYFGITAGPVSAATLAMVSAMSAIPGHTITLVDILIVVLPASLIGIIAGAFVAKFIGKDLDKDPVFLDKMKDPEFRKSIEESSNKKNKVHSAKAKLSVVVFLLGVALIVLFGLKPELSKIQTDYTIDLIMLSVVLINVLFAGVKATEVSKSTLFRSGAEAVISIFGVVWMSRTFITANESTLVLGLQDIVANHPGVFSLALFFMSALMFSQASTVKAIIPLGIKLGLLPPTLIAMYPAANGLFFIPANPVVVAAINFDKTGTTRVGKFLVNHSFMLPGIVTTIVTVISGFLISRFFM
jgi:anaerobic C4-dicarboxylate transporter DcuA